MVSKLTEFINMKSTIFENGEVKIITTEKPSLQNKQGAIVKVYGCGLCGSDIVKIKNNEHNIKLGHEVVGEIVEINTNTNFKISDIVALGHHIPCFKCEFCQKGHHSMCRHFKETNIYPCGFSEYIYITEEHLGNTVFKLPENMDYITASFMEPLACCIRAIRKAELYNNSNVLISGLGTIGLLTGQAVKAFGHTVNGCDLLENRITLAKQLCFDDAFNIDKIQNKSYDAVFMTSGSDKAIETAINAVKDGGTIVIFSSTPNNMGYCNNEIYYRELKIFGSYSPEPKDLETSLKFLAEKKVIVNNLSTIYSLDNINMAIEDTITNKIMKAYIKL